jgi:hypothetical protein
MATMVVGGRRGGGGGSLAVWWVIGSENCSGDRVDSMECRADEGSGE